MTKRKADEEQPKKTGRRPIELDKEQFEEMCRLHFSQAAIARKFGIDPKTLSRWCKRTYKVPFSAVLDQKRLEGERLLVRTALEQAEKTPSVLIFLLKNWCKYSDNPKDEASGNDGLVPELRKWLADTGVLATPAVADPDRGQAQGAEAG